MKLLEIHALQNFSPSLLNRDDTGSHKEAQFGGVRRARVSSQSWKRAMRDYVKDLELLEPSQGGVRSKRLHGELKRKFLDVAASPEEADWVAEAVLVFIGAYHIESDSSAEGDEAFSQRELKSEYLVFLGQDRVDAVAKLVGDNWSDAVKAGLEVKKYREKVRSDKKDKYKGKLDDKDKFHDAVAKALKKPLQAQIESAFDGSKAVDVALFGRMLADMPEKNVDGSFYVAHPISTHEASREFDYYTAVDDLKPKDTQGADMIGNTEFNSACYYRYAVLDLESLQKTLDDKELVRAGLTAFLRAFLNAFPSGKQHSHAAFNPWSFFAIRVQGKAMPLNFANAFESPVKKGNQGFIKSSIQELDSEWQWADQTFGETGFTAYCTRHTEPLSHFKSKQYFESMDGAISAAVDEAMKLLGN
jgi:CRISPR system Cascade subunit CasC